MTQNQMTAILEFAKAQPNEARAIFDLMAKAEMDLNERAAFELVREWACNPNFRERLREYVWRMNQ